LGRARAGSASLLSRREGRRRYTWTSLIRASTTICRLRGPAPTAPLTESKNSRTPPCAITPPLPGPGRAPLAWTCTNALTVAGRAPTPRPSAHTSSIARICHPASRCEADGGSLDQLQHTRTLGYAVQHTPCAQTSRSPSPSAADYATDLRLHLGRRRVQQPLAISVIRAVYGAEPASAWHGQTRRTGLLTARASAIVVEQRVRQVYAIIMSASCVTRILTRPSSRNS
jgi:hypothetical protein